MRAPAGVLACLLLLSACSRGRGEMMPAFALVDQAGAVVKSESLRGRVVVVSFVFTTCAEACPLITAQLARTQTRVRTEKLDDRVRFVSITLDPATDRPEVLRRYAAQARDTPPALSLILLAMPDEDVHAPNEFFRLSSFDEGLRTWPMLLSALGALTPGELRRT